MGALTRTNILPRVSLILISRHSLREANAVQQPMIEVAENETPSQNLSPTTTNPQMRVQIILPLSQMKQKESHLWVSKDMDQKLCAKNPLPKIPCKNYSTTPNVSIPPVFSFSTSFPRGSSSPHTSIIRHHF